MYATAAATALACVRYEPAAIQPKCRPQPRGLRLQADTTVLAAGVLAGRVATEDGRSLPLATVEFAGFEPLASDVLWRLIPVDTLARFRAEGLPPGRYITRVRHLGFFPRADTIDVAAKAARAVILPLEFPHCGEDVILVRRKPWWKVW